MIVSIAKPKAPTVIPKNQIDVWHVPLDDFGSKLNAFRKVLSAGEVDQCERFAFDHLKRRFIIRRSLLRMVLGHYLNLQPVEIDLRFSLKDKPALITHNEDSALQFNTSHSQDACIIAVSGGKLGIDIEYVRTVSDLKNLAKRIFSPQELAVFNRVDEEEQLSRFFRSWTIKEAIVKATGEGLSGDVSTITTAIDNQQMPIMRKGILWHLHSIDTPCGFHGTVASEFSAPNIIYKSTNSLLSSG